MVSDKSLLLNIGCLENPILGTLITTNYQGNFNFVFSFSKFMSDISATNDISLF